MIKRQLRFLKGKFIEGINNFPFNSNVLGTPRHCSNVATYLSRHPEIHVYDLKEGENIQLPLPFLNKPELSAYFVCARKTLPQFVFQLPGARVWGANGAVITRDDTFLIDVSREFGMKKPCVDHSVFHTIFLGRAKYINHNVAVITTAGTNVYYHWLLDILPRLLLLKESGLFDKIDYFIIDYKNLPFQKQSLDLLQINKVKIIVCDKNWGFHIRANQIFVPSLPSRLNQVNAYECELLKKYFLEIDTLSVESERIYITRRKAGTRMIINESDLINYLEKFNFKVIELELLTIQQQAELFYNAQVIVGPHGSGFANICFSKQGCHIVDILPDTNIVTCFHNIASQVGAKYYGYIGRGVPMNDSNKNDNIQIDLNTFADYFESNVLTAVAT